MPTRLRLMLALVYLGILVLAGRLFWLQVLEHDRYATLSKGNYLKTESIPAPRGRILDAGGLVLADNRLAYDLVYTGGAVRFARRILDLLKLEAFPEVEEGAVVVAANLPEELVPTLAELTAGQPNLRLVERVERYYPHPISGPVIGYVQRASPEDIKRGYDPRDLVGKAGLEAALEERLRGRRGIKLVERDVRGVVVREEVLVPPVPGEDVRLTLRYELQKATERFLKEALADVNAGRRRLGLPEERVLKGAAVAIDPKTGAVLAMASSPDFDPNVFVRRPVEAKRIRAIIQNPARPLLNRAVQAYTPGSTFKPVSASALIERGLIPPRKVYRCTPWIVFGGQVRRNWSARDMGPMTVEEALAWSCNTWFYQAVIDAGPKRALHAIAERAHEFGLGEPTGVELRERRGLVPTEAWKREVYGEPWYPGETLSVAIGQGPVLVTPVQLARAYAGFFTGELPRLHLVAGEAEREKIPGRYFTLIRRGLRKTVTEGTARSRFEGFPVPTAGKTGTAETPGKRAGYEHAWYAGFGPWPDDGLHPPLVAVAFVENGGEGSRAALPVVKKIMAAFWGIKEADADRGDLPSARAAP